MKARIIKKLKRVGKMQGVTELKCELYNGQCTILSLSNDDSKNYNLGDIIILWSK